jgi:hypothetical protein
MIHRFCTESESEYLIDTVNKTWERVKKNDEIQAKVISGLRDESGTFTECGEVIIGNRFSMICPPKVEGASLRYITTSPVIEIL